MDSNPLDQQLFRALQKKDNEAVRAALAAGANPVAQIGGTKLTLRHTACWTANSTALRLLLKTPPHASPEELDHLVLSLLDAARPPSIACLRLLVAKGAPLRATGQRGRPVLIGFLCKKIPQTTKEKCLDILLGAPQLDIDQPDDKGETAIWHALGKASLEGKILSRDPSLSMKNHAGETLLHDLSTRLWKGYVQMPGGISLKSHWTCVTRKMEVLVDRGASLLEKNAAGKTPLDLHLPLVQEHTPSLMSRWETALAKCQQRALHAALPDADAALHRPRM